MEWAFVSLCFLLALPTLFSLQTTIQNQEKLTPAEEAALLKPVVTKLADNTVFYEKGREYQYILGNLAVKYHSDNWRFDQKPWIASVNGDDKHKAIGDKLEPEEFECFGTKSFVVGLNGGYCYPLSWAYGSWKSKEHTSKKFFVALHDGDPDVLLSICEHAKKGKQELPPSKNYEKSAGVLQMGEPKYTYTLTAAADLDFAPMFTALGNGMYFFSVPDAHHNVVMFKSAKHYLLFDPNAGVASASTLENFHHIFNDYFHHSVIFNKYSKKGGIRFELQEMWKPKA